MNRLLFLIGFMFFLSSLTYGQRDNIIGKWITDGGESKIKIYKAKNGRYYGQIIWLRDNPDEKDVNNPDERKRNKPVKGLIIMKGFEYEGKKKQWINGTIYDPDNGKTYSCYMWFEGNKNKLHIKGYILGMKFIGRSTVWNKDPS